MYGTCHIDNEQRAKLLFIPTCIQKYDRDSKEEATIHAGGRRRRAQNTSRRLTTMVLYYMNEGDLVSAGKDLEDLLYIRQLLEGIYFDKENTVAFIENNVRAL